MKTIALKYSWRMRGTSGEKKILRDFGECIDSLDFTDSDIALTESNQVQSQSVPVLITRLKQSLADKTVAMARTDSEIKELLHLTAWTPDIYKLVITGVTVS
jgi:hypothetical protein